MNEPIAGRCITLQEVMTNGITTVTVLFSDCRSTSIVPLQNDINVYINNTILIMVIIWCRKVWKKHNQSFRLRYLHRASCGTIQGTHFQCRRSEKGIACEQTNAMFPYALTSTRANTRHKSLPHTCLCVISLYSRITADFRWASSLGTFLSFIDLSKWQQYYSINLALLHAFICKESRVTRFPSTLDGHGLFCGAG